MNDLCWMELTAFVPWQMVIFSENRHAMIFSNTSVDDIPHSQ